MVCLSFSFSWNSRTFVSHSVYSFRKRNKNSTIKKGNLGLAGCIVQTLIVAGKFHSFTVAKHCQIFSVQDVVKFMVDFRVATDNYFSLINLR